VQRFALDFPDGVKHFTLSFGGFSGISRLRPTLVPNGATSARGGQGRLVVQARELRRFKPEDKPLLHAPTARLNVM
jgi:hypothetical protein